MPTPAATQQASWLNKLLEVITNEIVSTVGVQVIQDWTKKKVENVVRPAPSSGSGGGTGAEVPQLDPGESGYVAMRDVAGRLSGEFLSLFDRYRGVTGSWDQNMTLVRMNSELPEHLTRSILPSSPGILTLSDVYAKILPVVESMFRMHAQGYGISQIARATAFTENLTQAILTFTRVSFQEQNVIEAALSQNRHWINKPGSVDFLDIFKRQIVVGRWTILAIQNNGFVGYYVVTWKGYNADGNFWEPNKYGLGTGMQQFLNLLDRGKSLIRVIDPNTFTQNVIAEIAKGAQAQLYLVQNYQFLNECIAMLIDQQRDAVDAFRNTLKASASDNSGMLRGI